MEETSSVDKEVNQTMEEDFEDEIQLDSSVNKSVETAGPTISTQDLVLAAITVMKGRKARPDTKRLCNWVHRKYGRSIQEVVQEIDSLCVQGILDKVEYKGSISFRVVSERKMHKRAGRRKSNGPSSQESNGIVKSEPGTPTSKKTNKKVESPDKLEKNEPLTVNLIVAEELRPELGDIISKGEIIRAIELSSRPINKKAVMRDLETILAQEIHLGYLNRLGEDTYCLPQLETARNYRGTITPKVSKRKPKPTHKILEMEAELLSKARQDKFEEERKLFNLIEETKIDCKTEDQLKDDLIKEKLISNKLFKMRSKMKLTKIKIKKEKPIDKDETQVSKLIKLENNDLKFSNIINVKEERLNVKEERLIVKEERLSEEESKPTGPKEDTNAKKAKKKKEAWHVSDIKDKSESSADSKEKVVNGIVQMDQNHKPFLIKEAIANETIKDKTNKKSKTPISKQSQKTLRLNNSQITSEENEENGNQNHTDSKIEEDINFKVKDSPKVKKTKKKDPEELYPKELTEKPMAKKETKQPVNKKEIKEAVIKKEIKEPLIKKEVEETVIKKEVEEVNQMPDVIPARASSGRKKRARKIFDPADHDLPARVIKKCRVSTSPPPPVNYSQLDKSLDQVKETTETKVNDTMQDKDTSNVKEMSQAKATPQVKDSSKVKEPTSVKDIPLAKKTPPVKEKVKVNPSPRKRGGVGSRRKEKVMYDQEPENCLYCDQGDKKNEKLVSCKDCRTTVHPSCLNYPEDLTDRIYSQPWQCLNCKTCFVCNKAGNDDQLLFCDSCDLGYHMPCHKPTISAKPVGRWECAECAISTGWVPPPPPQPDPPSLEQQFESDLPPLPPGTGGSWSGVGGGHGIFCPPPDLPGPAHWEDIPVDSNIPDITGWSAARVSQYLVQNGIQEIHAKVFFDEEIDGRSVLLMCRSDIISRLGVKLGPALKIYNRIRRLQTRREFNY